MESFKNYSNYSDRSLSASIIQTRDTNILGGK